MMTSLLFPDRRVFSVLLYPRVYFPDFITSARRELIDSAVFFIFLGGAISHKLVRKFLFIPVAPVGLALINSIHFRSKMTFGNDTMYCC